MDELLFPALSVVRETALFHLKNLVSEL